MSSLELIINTFFLKLFVEIVISCSYVNYFVTDKSEFSEVTECSVAQVLTDITESSFKLIENDVKKLYLNV
jgi:hypothetical protein